jgi:hypothetical protein
MLNAFQDRILLPDKNSERVVRVVSPIESRRNVGRCCGIVREGKEKGTTCRALREKHLGK